jgi:hypothetical protein
MARKKNLPTSDVPTIHEAELESGGSGVVLRGAKIDPATAIAGRKSEKDIVVCSNDLKANRKLAQTIETAVGPCERHEPHDLWAGPNALPHFQQQTGFPGGHSFYETGKRKARKKKS